MLRHQFDSIGLINFYTDHSYKLLKQQSVHIQTHNQFSYLQQLIPPSLTPTIIKSFKQISQFQQNHLMIGNFINNIPPVTRILLFIIGTIGLLNYGQIIDRYNLFFNTEKIFVQGQIWRLITSLACFKQQNLFFLLQLYFFINISSSVQRSSFKRGSIDFLYFLSLMCLFIYFFAIVLKISFLSGIFIYAMYYYYGRIHSNRIIIVNFLPMRASFLIWFILLIEWIFGSHDLKSCVLSIVIGHTLYFLYNVYPKMRFVDDKDFFDTPQFFVRLVTPLFNEEHAHQNQVEDQIAF